MFWKDLYCLRSNAVLDTEDKHSNQLIKKETIVQKITAKDRKELHRHTMIRQDSMDRTNSCPAGQSRQNSRYLSLTLVSVHIILLTNFKRHTVSTLSYKASVLMFLLRSERAYTFACT